MALHALLDALPFQPSITSFLFATSSISLISYIFYRAYFDPLASVPGPLLWRLTSVVNWYYAYNGTEGSRLNALHKRYGPVVRVGPRDVVISDGDALAPIYTEKGGFLKASCYSNFDFDGHSTIFSALDPKHRSIRSKAVMPLFSTSNIRSRNDIIEKSVNGLISRLQREAARSRAAAKETGKPLPINVQNLARGLAIDTVTSYLFGKDYGGVHEQNGKLSASEYVDSVVAFGRFFYMPTFLFTKVISLYSWLYPNPQASDSTDTVSGFTDRLVADSPVSENYAEDDGLGTYQSRLLDAGISQTETSIQMQDVIFAGTDTTGTNIAHVLHQLAKNPSIHAKLRAELSHSDDAGDTPYLDALIRETLRTSMSNPTRFPRQVPPQGWTYTPSSSSSSRKSYYFPPGTILGLQTMTLHYDPQIYPSPHTFSPDRWLPENEPTPEMYRNHFPFGLGPRQCIARNLAMAELVACVRAVARSNVLEGAKVVQDTIRMTEWFNARVVGGRVDLVWE